MKKILSRSFFILTIALILAPAARADFNWPNPSKTATQMLNSILSNLGLDKNEIQYAAKTFNESRQKKQAPEVTLNFEPSNPAPGEKITAVAQPTNFFNDISKLYYTWYIKHASNNKDLNGDGKIDIEDYKIEAARIIASNDFEWEKANYSQDTDNDGYEASFGGDDQKGKNDHCYYHDTESGNEIEIACQHLFPDDRLSGDLGENNFGADREAFWHTDPNNPDTRGTGNTDEANVIGLGIQQFTWNYQPGDQVGVAVEGISSEPSQTDDSSYKTMWALPKNKCSAFAKDVEDIVDTTAANNGTTSSTTTDTQVSAPDPVTGNVTETVTETITTTTTDVTTFQTTTTVVTNVTTTVYSGYSDANNKGTEVSVSTTSNTSNSADVYSTDQDLNDCLDDNLIDPIEGGTNNKIEVTLTPMPNGPINDPTGENSDELIVQAATTNTKDKSALKYAWQVYGSSEPNPESWGAPFLKSDLPDVKQTIGVGLSAFKMKMAMANPPKYLKIKVTVTEKTADNVSREGHNDVVVPVFSTTNQIHVYPTNTTSDLTLQRVTDKERCTTGMEKVICPVVKNEIVGLSVPDSLGTLSNILWTVDNNPLTPITYGTNGATCLSGECTAATGEATNIAYFPVLKEKGEKYTVNFSATNSAGQKTSLTRTLEVVDPKITIVSADEATCRPTLLGNYVDLDEKLWPDYSDTSFEAAAGQTISLKPVFNMPFTSDAQWYIDNVAINNDTAQAFGASIDPDTQILTFPANKATGEIYSVAYGAIYSQPNTTKKILNASFGVQLNEFYEKQLGNAIEITVVDALDGSQTAKTPAARRIIASLITDVPTYINFLFRIVLTTALLLFSAWIVSALFQKDTHD